MILLDTDHLSILTNTRDRSHGVLVGRMEGAGTEDFGVPDTLAKLFDFLGAWEIVRFDGGAAREFKHLRKLLRRLGARDLKIAATALTNDVLLLSANLHGFRQVPGLRVENWLI